MFAWLARRHRRRLLAEPFPATWDAILDANVAVTHRLTTTQRARLRQLITLFIADKHWEACSGLELTEEMQVTVAAQACLLLLGIASSDDSDPLALYRDVTSILIYPSTIITPPRPLGTFEQPRSPISHGTALIGEAILRGPTILAWDAVLAGGREEHHGNVVLHEFAHKLDMANGLVDGTPPLRTRAERRRWAVACAAAYARHHAAVAAGLPTLMDSYGATNEAEFFAVATETYFTRPLDLAFEHPALYAALAAFYGFTPPTTLSSAT
jgi:MtfA peptidase